MTEEQQEQESRILGVRMLMLIDILKNTDQYRMTMSFSISFSIFSIGVSQLIIVYDNLTGLHNAGHWPALVSLVWL